MAREKLWRKVMSQNSQKGTLVITKKSETEYAFFQGKSVRNTPGKGPRKEFNFYLGRPVDKERLAFYQKSHGLYIFDADNLIKINLQKLHQGIVVKNFDQAMQAWEIIKNNSNNELIKSASGNANPFIVTEKCILTDDSVDTLANFFHEGYIQNLEFGASYFLSRLIDEIDYKKDVLSKIPNIQLDDVLALILFRIQSDYSYNKAALWFSQDFSSILFPNVILSSQNTSNILKNIGDSNIPYNFFRLHSNYIRDIYSMQRLNCNVDSTPFDNTCSIHITRKYSHGNKHHYGFRLIVVIHIPTGLPLYYHIIHGNIIDQTTIDQLIETLKLYGYHIGHIIGDAGYCNINCLERLLFLDDISSFMTRFNDNFKSYSTLIEEALKNFEETSEIVKYNGRILYGKIIIKEMIDKRTLEKRKSYIYLFRDENTYSLKFLALQKSSQFSTMSNEQIAKARKKYGVFAIVSTRKLSLLESLEEYYNRLSVEQYFDTLKNDLDSLPVRMHNEETVLGHIFISFIASFFLTLIKRRMKMVGDPYINIYPTYNDDNIYECDQSIHDFDIIEQEIEPKLATISFSSVLYELRGQKALVFNGVVSDCNSSNATIIIPGYPHAQCKSMYKAFGLRSPFKIEIIGNKFNITYKSKKPNINPKKIAFSDIPCKVDLNNIKKGNCTINKQNNSDIDFDKVDSFFDPWINGTLYNIKKSGAGRKPGSKNKSTLERLARDDEKIFNTFDNFFDPWDIDTSCNTKKSKAGRKPGSKNKSTIERLAREDEKVFNTFDNFFDPWDIDTSSNTKKSKAGRKPGSKNKSTLE